MSAVLPPQKKRERELAHRVHKALRKPGIKLNTKMQNMGKFFDKPLSKEEDIQRAKKKAEHLFIRRYKPKLQEDRL